MQNYEYLSSLNKNIQVTPVLKSNAYGHGLLEIAKTLDTVNAPFFSVNSFEEAYLLWKANIKTPIHIMGYVDPEDLKKDLPAGRQEILPFSYTIYNYEQLQAIIEHQPGAKIHIFIDTGMHREGFLLDKLENLLKILKKNKKIKVVGLMSHLANTDKNSATIDQLREFRIAHNMLKDYGFSIRWRHIFASAGLLNFALDKKYNFLNLARVGKAIYGIDPRGKNPNLSPVLKFDTKIVQIKILSKGKRVGYDGTYTTPHKTTIGILPVGYADGLDRRLSNKGFVLVEGISCKILGRISMNITTINISKIKKPRVGQKVTIISANPKDPNTIENFAIKTNTIPYDLAVKINPFITRYIQT